MPWKQTKITLPHPQKKTVPKFNQLTFLNHPPRKKHEFEFLNIKQQTNTFKKQTFKQTKNTLF